jgi:predicted nucleotide-binding protein (sugar kinase/HSP70/actin superfamily)
VTLNGKVQVHEEPDSREPVIPAAELTDDTRRLIVATCEKGAVEDVDAMREIKAGLDAAKKLNPNMASFAAKRVWQDFKPEPMADPVPTRPIRPATRQRTARMRARAELRIGIPRVLNLYSVTPFFTAYLGSLGVPFGNIAFSDFTSEALYRAGAKRGAIDPCYPSKVAIAHVHNLIHKHHARSALDWILFPMVDSLPSCVSGTQASRACPTVTATPEVVKAAFTKEGDVFEEHGLTYVSPFLDFSDEELLARQMHETLGPLLGLSRSEAERACAEGLRALARYDAELKEEGREILDRLVKEDRLGIVVLGRPYHSDPGFHHDILDELQKEGYPILTQDSLPNDDAFLEPLFRAEVEAGVIADGRDISDVWKNSYSENTSRKIWAAKVTARHPNLVGLELSSFKCGHDAPIYTVVEEIVERSGTPFFAFKDIDENKPTGSIKIRVETITYFLTRYREDMIRTKNRLREIEEEVRAYQERLRADLARKVEVA